MYSHHNFECRLKLCSVMYLFMTSKRFDNNKTILLTTLNNCANIGRCQCSADRVSSEHSDRPAPQRKWCVEQIKYS